MELVEPILGLCCELNKMGQTAKSNKALCQQVADRVRSLEMMVLSIRQRPDSVSPNVRTALIELTRSLEDATELMRKLSKTNVVSKVLNSSINESKFQEVGQKLSQDLQMLSMALQISHGDTLREGLRNIMAEHRAIKAQSLEPLHHKPVLQVTQANEGPGGAEASGDADEGPGALDGGAAQDSTTFVTKMLLSSVNRVKPLLGKETEEPGTPLAKLSESKAPVPVSPTSTSALLEAQGSTTYSSRQSPIHMPPSFAEPTLMSPVPMVSPMPMMSPRPMMSPMPMMSPRPMMSPMPMMTPRPMVSPMPMMSPVHMVSPMPMMSPVQMVSPMVSPMPMMSPVQMVSPMVSPPVPSFPYSYAPTPSGMSFNPMAMAYQQRPNNTMNTATNYNNNYRDFLKLTRALASVQQDNPWELDP
ncbi:myosin tail region-interacting protein MTI1-like isoform X5 [Syngnathus acus]|uniref:myosin tail region-interacting protein MTI1-like isoform X5 n=1 Tax=Syngnathus acus TaxID=161584 RepID=UPI001885CAE4|nr:myosin tail region-interacting protein MTI1-like isoform X5 [Syngnathus acus]